MPTNNQAHQDYSTLVKMASSAAIATVLVMLLAKIYAWFMTNSGALLASTADSALDLFASLSSFMIVRYALQPADHNHKFGHGKAENLAGIAQSAFVMGSAFLLVLHGSHLLVAPQPIQHSEIGIAITLITIVLTLGLVAFQRYVINKTQSVAISADSLHYKSDILMNIGVIIALLLSQTQWQFADGLFTIAVGIYLGVGAAKIIYVSIQQLMDTELSTSEIKEIEFMISAHDEVLGFHDIRTRQSGATRFIQFHLELDDSLSLFEAHRIGEEIELEITRAFAPCEVFVHHDPKSVVKSRLD